MKHLFALGFSQHFLSQLEPDELDAVLSNSPTCAPARVTFVAHGQARLLLPRPASPPVELLALLPGDLRDACVVGDWLLVRAEHDPPLGLRRLDRRGLLRRRDPDGGSQPVAANVDLGLVCTALGRDLSLRRAERWLALCAEAELDSVIVLTKADPGVDATAAIGSLQALGTAPVVPLSGLHGTGLEALLEHLAPGRTGTLLGSSGVGKSTLLNRLLGTAAQDTGEVRGGDSKGRHTTTARQLFRLPGGAMVIDNPGVREVGLVAEDGVGAVFPEIEALLPACRYRDCSHGGDDGCAVDAALDRGELDPDRVAAWHKLRKEAAYEARRGDAAARAEERARWKRIHLAARLRTRLREEERG